MIEGFDHNRIDWKDLADLFPDQVGDGLHFQPGCQPCLDLVDDAEFLGVLFGAFKQALGLIEQAGILKRHAHGRSQGGQQADVGRGKGIFLLDILQADETVHLLTGDERHKDHRFGFLCTRNYLQFEFLAAPFSIFVDQQDIPGLDDVFTQLVEGITSFIIEAFSLLPGIIKQPGAVNEVEGVNDDRIDLEYLDDLIPDQVVDGLQFELGCQPFLDLVDDGQLMGALFGFREETGVFQEGAHVDCQGLQQMEVIVVEGMLLLGSNDNQTEGFILGQDGHPQPRLSGFLISVIFILALQDRSQGDGFFQGASHQRLAAVDEPGGKPLSEREGFIRFNHPALVLVVQIADNDHVRFTVKEQDHGGNDIENALDLVAAGADECVQAT